jgi:hypothetical protein
MLFTLDFDRARTGDADEKHVHLLVDVPRDAASCAETYQVGVEIYAPIESPDYPRPTCARGCDLTQAYRTFHGYTTSILTWLARGVSCCAVQQINGFGQRLYGMAYPRSASEYRLRVGLYNLARRRK